MGTRNTLIALAVVATVLLAIVQCAGPNPTTCSVQPSDRLDCGAVGVTETTCQARGCCWDPTSPGGAPYCFVASNQDTCFVDTTKAVGTAFPPESRLTMLSYFLRNLDIDGKGGVVAAPDHDTPGGSYYYHWERDGALSMAALQQLSVADGLFPNSTRLQQYFSAYIRWVSRVQDEVDPHGIDVRVEPKYLLPGGQVLPSAWCRPQTDGPALRALALMAYAQLDLTNPVVAATLWHPNSGRGGLIAHDLDWVAANWTQSGCDLWEEIRSDDFFWNRAVFRKALLRGAAFAAQMGDSQRAATYGSAAQAVTAVLPSHFNGHFLAESQHRKLDGATLCALNDAFTAESPLSLLDPLGTAAMGTVSALESLFCSTFAINEDDAAHGVGGVLIGRYPGDVYAGGNPWILLTGALSQLYFRMASSALMSAQVDAEGQSKSARVDALAQAALYLNKGESVLERLEYHVKGGGYHLDEQLDRNTGFEASAKDLTWSYATVLKALNERQKAMDLDRSVRLMDM